MQARNEQIIQIAAIVLLVVGCLVVLLPFLAGILSAAILCFSTWPLYDFLERRLRGRRTLAALLMTLLVLVILVLPLTLIAVSYADEIPDMVDYVRELLEQGLPFPPTWVASIPLVGEWLDASWRELAGSKAELAEALRRWIVPAREVLVRTGIIIGEGVLQLTLIAFIGFFFYRDGRPLIQALRTALSHVAGKMSGQLLDIVGGTINAVVYGIIGTGIAQALAALIGFLIAGVPGALMLSFLTFFLSIIPAGPAVLWIGATVWLFLADRLGWAIFMAIWGFFVVSGIDNVVKPILISRGASLSFALVLLGVFGGVLAFGFVGIFLGPTLLAVGFNLARRWTETAATTPPVNP